MLTLVGGADASDSFQVEVPCLGSIGAPQNQAWEIKKETELVDW